MIMVRAGAFPPPPLPKRALVMVVGNGNATLFAGLLGRPFRTAVDVAVIFHRTASLWHETFPFPFLVGLLFSS